MPPKRPDHPNKRARLESTPKFIDAGQIRTALRSDSPEELTSALTSLRNQLTIKPQEPAILPQDERLTLVKEWMESSIGAYDLFMLWDKATLRQSTMIALIVSLVSSILTLLSAHYNNHLLGQPIMKSLLTPSRLRHLNSYIGGSNNELVLVTLKLFNVMSSFASGRDRKAVLEGFGWEIKSLPKLLNMRRKTHGETDTTDPLLRPDIRTLYVQLLLSFVDIDSPTQTKALFLEQHREPFLAMFKGIGQDHYSFARRILEVCWAGIWSDAKLKRTVKVGLFNESTIGHIMKLYDRILAEGDDDDHIPAKLVHHFLLAICTRPGTGICFKDRGWYPRESDADDIALKEDDDGKRKYGKIYNKILANILKTLKVNEDSRQQELAIKILSSCPELVSGYWSAVALTLEPRLASKWITNIAVFGSIISLPIPTSSFYLPNTQLYQPTPPPLSTVIENIFPSVNTKNNFSKGLQSPSGLVQHCTALALARCLIKYQKVREHFQKIATSLEENEDEGQWFKRCRELERDIRRRVPDFQVLVAFSQQKHVDPKVQTNSTKTSLLAESSQRLLWLYHRCLPSMVAEVRFDVGKLLQTFSHDIQTADESQEPQEESDASSRLYRVQQLHVLSLLKDSDQFVWTGKIASLPQTPFYILLAALSSATIPAIRIAISSLLQRILSQSILFQEDKNEPELWLNILPRKRPVVIGLYSSIFQGETEGVVMFLDDCVQRCLKTPYRYVEALHSLIHPSGTVVVPSERLDTYPSPLLMTVLEQLGAKINNKSLAPSHVIGVVSFLRKLIFSLAGKTTDLQFLHSYSTKFETVVNKERIAQNYPELSIALSREFDILHSTLSFSTCGRPMTSDTSTLENYLQTAESFTISEVEEVRQSRVLGLIDWMRTLDHSLTTSNLVRLAVVVTAYQLSKLPLVLENLIPGQADLWKALEMKSRFSELRQNLGFRWVYLNSGAEDICDSDCQAILSDLIFSHNPSLLDIKRNVYLILHFIASTRQHNAVLKGHVSLLARVLQRSNTLLSPLDLISLKEVIFVQPNVLKDLMMLPSSFDVLEGMQILLASAISPASESDRTLVSTISDNWFNVLKNGIAEQSSESIATGSIWIKYLKPDRLFDLLDSLEKAAQEMPSDLILRPINVVLEALSSIGTFEWEAEDMLVERLPQLIALRPILPDSTLLEDVIAVAIDASLPICLNGSPPFSCSSSSSDLVDVTRRSESRWSQRHRSVKVELDIRSFLQQTQFTASTAKIISGIIYRQPHSPDLFVEWLKSSKCLQKDSDHIVPIIHALLDSNRLLTKSPFGTDLWRPFIPKFLEIITRNKASSDLRLHARQSLVAVLESCGAESSTLFDVLEKELESLPERKITSELLSAGVLMAKSKLKANAVMHTLIERGMQSCIRKFAEGPETPEECESTERLASLVQESRISKAHIVETLLTVIIQNRFSSVSALRLAIICLSTCQLKPLIVNRQLQSIIQHPHFFKVCLSSVPDLSEARDKLVEALYCLFNIHPSNTCQVTHIEPLIKIYRATLSPSDLRILSIFRLFEGEKKLSIIPLLARWSSTPTSTSQTSLEAIQSLDPICVLRTCINFPRWRSLEDQSKVEVSPQEASLYDPVFVMLLFSQMLSDHPPTSAFEWIELFRTNVASLFIRALSSKDGVLRDLALCQVVALWRHMQTADLQEQPHVLYILDLLKDLMPTPVLNSFTVSENPRRLPTYTALLLMHSLRAIFHPSNFIYPITARFLLQRPTLDVEDVPMLYGLLYSSADESWKKERTWMIKFLADGMVSSEDWRILKRRHTWDLLASLFQSAKEIEDAPLRLAILEVLANLTCNMQATTSLVLKSALLPWIEMQLLQSTTKAEGVEWIKILDNIVVVVDAGKIETLTNGEWRVIICRCLSYLLNGKICATTNENFPHAVPLILRLSALDGPTLSDLPSLLNLAVKCLQSFEKAIELGENATAKNDAHVLPSAPHRSFNIHQRFSSSSATLQSCGDLLENLWKASMNLTQKCNAWEKLTPRMLLWNAYRRIDASKQVVDVAEWARKEVVRSLQSS